MTDPDQLLTAIDAARILGLSTDMVRLLTKNGRLPSTRTANGYYLFRRGDVERLRAEREEDGQRDGRHSGRRMIFNPPDEL